MPYVARRHPKTQLRWTPLPRKEHRAVEVDLVATDEIVHHQNSAHTVTLDDAVTIGNDCVPVVQETSAQRSHSGVRPYPVRVTGEEPAKVRKDLGAAVHACRYSRVAIDRIVSVERQQALWVVASPGGQPAIGKLSRLVIGQSKEGRHG